MYYIGNYMCNAIKGLQIYLLDRNDCISMLISRNCSCRFIFPVRIPATQASVPMKAATSENSVREKGGLKRKK